MRHRHRACWHSKKQANDEELKCHDSISVNDFRTAAPGVIEGLFIHRDAIARHLTAPMLSEREIYLGQLLVLGHKRKFVAERASMLLNVVEHLHKLSTTQITEGDITSAARRLQDTSIMRRQKPPNALAETS